MQYLKQSTAVTLKIGPFLDDTDGKTTETALTIAQADVRLSKNGGDIAQKTEATSCTHDELGIYGCPIDETDTATLGRLQLWVHEAGALPVWHEFMVIPANVYDSLYSTDLLQVDVTQLLGTAWLAPGVAGTPDVNAKLLGSTAQTGRDIGANVLLSAGSGTGQLDFTSGVVKSNLAQILGTALTETAGYIAAAFKKLFNVQTPLLVASDVMRGTDGANTVVPPSVAEFEARSILAADYVVVGDTIAGVTAVSNDVGITQAGADKVWGTAARALTDKVDFALSTAGILSIWHQLTANIVTADTIGKLLKDNINAPVGSIPTTPTLQATWTDARAGYLDNINNAELLNISAAILGRIDEAISAAKTLTAGAITSIRQSVCLTGDPASSIGKLLFDNLNAPVGSIPTTPTLQATWTDAKAAFLDIAISSRSSHIAADIWTAASRELSTPNNYKADISALALEATLTAMKGATFAGATDSLEAIRDRGDAAWLTATGFATLNPPSQVLADYKADVSALALEATLTAMKGTGFLTGTDSLEAIRDRGDAAWLTGGAGSLTAAEIADAVLDEQLSDHIDSGSMGEKVYGIRARVPLSPWTKMDLDKHFKLLNDIVKSLDTLPKVKKLDQLTDNVQSLSATLHADVSKAHLILDKQLKSDEKLIGSHTQSIRNIQKLQKDVDEFTHKLSQLASSYDEAIQQSSAKLSALFASSFSESDEKHSRKIVELQNKLDNLDKFDLKPIIEQISTISDSLSSLSQNEEAKGEEVQKLLQQLSIVLKEIEDTPFEKFSKYLKAMFIANLPTETVRQLLTEELAPIKEVLLADMETEADDKPNGEEEEEEEEEEDG